LLDEVLVTEVVAGGGAPPFGDGRNGGWYIQPTVITGLPPQARTTREEIFGPICQVAPFDAEVEADAPAAATPDLRAQVSKVRRT
jgi:aminomuconate-semialdehyde/2-hydroxymuconate-6-semialdehyde dehydrogenase